LGELVINGLLGFVFGYKIIGAFLVPTALDDPQSFILSSQGSFLAGMLMALAFGALKWWEKQKTILKTPETRILRIWPQDRVGDIVIYAAVFGFLGAKVFHNLENWKEFTQDPIGSLIAFSGLTFYGGLICAGAAIIWYARRHKIPLLPFADAFAPTMMFAYAFGRVGCQISGDGDWGILNNSPKPFSWLPDWAWSYTYPHNVLEAGVPIPGCTGPFCNQLPAGVYPTPLYEILACLVLFAVLLLLRKKLRIPGQMAAVYLVLNGLERFFIEKIRVNTQYDLPFQPTQAELISLGLMAAGVLLWIMVKRHPLALPKKP
jgi:prolipoprotein diacylglyceryl transferase